MLRKPLLLLRLLPLACMTLGPAPAKAADPDGWGLGCYEWRLSFSETDPYLRSRPPAAGVHEVYLWLAAVWNGDGMTAAEMVVRPSPGLEFLGFEPRNGFLNAGTGSHLLLAVGGCPDGPVVAGKATLYAADATGGSVCTEHPSGPGIPIDTVDCNVFVPFTWPGGYSGCTTVPGEYPCELWFFCYGGVPVEPTSWGDLKAMYRDDRTLGRR